MRILFYITGIAIFLILAGLSYSQNYATRDVLSEIERLRSTITQKQNQLRALEDEWAYLNRPERIKDLVVLNFQHLQMMRREPGPKQDFSSLPFMPAPSEYDPSEAILE